MNSLKTVGLASMAALALTATLGIASASASQFRSEAYPVKFSGEQGSPEKGEWLVFNLPGTGTSAKLQCQTHRASTVASAASSTVTLTPSEFGECKWSGLKVTVTPNSCKYVLDSVSEAAPFSGTMGIVCNKEGESIEIAQGANCKLTIPAQSGLSTVDLSNSGTGRSRTVGASFNVSGLKYTGSSKCPASVVGSFENGTLKGSLSLKGSDEAGTYPIGVYLANEQVEEPRHFVAEKYLAFTEGKAGSGPTFSLKIGKFSCGSTSHLIDAIYGPAAGLSAATTFEGCAYLGSGIVTQSNGCEYTYTLSGEAAGSARVGLACPAGATMNLLWGGSCIMRFFPQEWPGAAKLESTGSGSTREVIMNVSLTGMKYETQSCLGVPNGTYTDGSLTVGWNVKGADVNGSQMGLWIE